MKVNYDPSVSKLRQAVQDEATSSTFRDVNDGLVALKNSVESLALQAEVPGGYANGISTKFIVHNMPSMISVNGIVQLKSSWTYANNVVTFKTPPASGATIESYYI